MPTREELARRKGRKAAVARLAEAHLGEADISRPRRDFEYPRQFTGRLDTIPPGSLEQAPRQQHATGEIVSHLFSLFGGSAAIRPGIQLGGVAVIMMCLNSCMSVKRLRARGS
jgi:hypothetical protein